MRSARPGNAAAFISEDHFARYVRKMRNLYATRSEATLNALDILDMTPGGRGTDWNSKLEYQT